MKKYFSYAAAIVAMLAMVASTGCGNDDTDNAGGPVIDVSPTLTVSAEGGMSHLSYSIINPVEGQQISASCDQDWLYSFDYSTDGQIGFKYAVYDDETQDRTATLTLTYPGAETKTVAVTQIRKGGMTFDIQVTDVSETGATVTITPSNNDQTYMYAVVSAAYMKEFDNPADFIQDDITYWEDHCDNEGYTFESFIKLMLRTGVHVDDELNDLDPNKEYCAYAYGMTPEKIITSGLSTAYFTTTKIDYTNVNFKVTYTNDTDYNATITVRPELEDGSLYAGGWTFTVRNSYAQTVDGETDEEWQATILSNLKEQVEEGYFTQDDLLHGEKTFYLSDNLGTGIRPWGGNTYYVYCFGLNANFNVDTNDGVFSRSEVKTNPVEVTNPCTFEVSVPESSIEDMEAVVEVTPSDESTSYFVALTPTKTIGLAGEGDETVGESLVVERMIQRLDLAAKNWWLSEDWVEKGPIKKSLWADLGWELKPEQELSVLIFGVDQFGRRSTVIAREDFKTTEFTQPSAGFSVDIEVVDNTTPGSLTVKFTPKSSSPDLDANKVRYYAGLVPSYQWESYEDWQAYVDDMVHSGLISNTATVSGEKTMTADVNYEMEYTIFAFAYKNGITYPDQDPDTKEVTTVALPKSTTANVSVEVRRYNGADVYNQDPVVWKDYQNSGIFTILIPTPNEAAVTWYYTLHSSRSAIPNSDGQMYRHFMDEDLSGYRCGKYGTFAASEGTFGVFCTARDNTGAWGPMNYQDVTLEKIAISEAETVPTSDIGLWLPDSTQKPTYPGNPDPRSVAATASSISSHTVSFGTPVRFSSASFMIADSEINRYNELKGHERLTESQPRKVRFSLFDTEGFESPYIPRN